MKRFLIMLLSLSLLLCFVGCSGSDIDKDTSSSSNMPSENASSTASLDTSSKEPTVDPATCTHEYEEKVTHLQAKALGIIQILKKRITRI